MINLNFIGISNDLDSLIVLMEDKSLKRIYPVKIQDNSLITNIILEYSKHEELSGDFKIDFLNIYYSPDDKSFHAKLLLTNNNISSQLSISIEKAISIIIRNNCPVYLENDDIYYHSNYDLIGENLTNDLLEKLIVISIDNEEFEIAAKLRDKIIKSF
jgi:hypothetical protein